MHGVNEGCEAHFFVPFREPSPTASQRVPGFLKTLSKPNGVGVHFEIPSFGNGPHNWVVQYLHDNTSERYQLLKLTSFPEQQGWVEICIDIDLVAHESASAFLFDLGCTGIVSEDLQGDCLKAYLPFNRSLVNTRKQINAFLLKLSKIFPEITSPKVKLTIIEDQDWNRTWRRFFHADRVTPSLTILPAWKPMPDAIDGHVIMIDPGPAFGTGQHATTRMCLEAMEKIRFPETWSMLDVGTGSGILAIYGAKLGAGKILAIDIDPEALRWAKHNIQINDTSGSIDLSATPLEQVKGSFSVLTANLTLDQLLDLLPHFQSILEPGGWLILSGILKDQLSEVAGVLHEHPFGEPETFYQDEWACIISRKNVDA